MGLTVLVGYHGCDRPIADRILGGDTFRKSAEPHQWLGGGAYFWDDDGLRAREWATSRGRFPPFVQPAVLRVEVHAQHVLDMDVCEHQDLVASLYPYFEAELRALKQPIPRNLPHPLGGGRPDRDRYLDHAMIEYVCQTLDHANEAATAAGRMAAWAPFEVVRGSFSGYEKLFPGSSLRLRSHRQFAVRDLKCIARVELV